MKNLLVSTLSRDTAAYKVLRWTYRPIKHSVPMVREWSSVPRRNRIIRERLQGNGFKGLQIGCGVQMGCGGLALPGWMNSDVVGTPGIDFPLDVTKTWPFPDRSLDAIYGSEVIEHIERPK